MATFVLVHGAWQGGWCWRRVATLLRQSGHEVFTPTLTGLGERSHLLSERIDLETHIEDLIAVLRCEEMSEVVLCGHSYGGMVITGVADRATDIVSSLVYLDALVPADGQCVLDLLPPKAVSSIETNSKSKGSVKLIAPSPAEAFGVSLPDQAWVNRHCVDHPLKTFEQPIRLEESWKQVRRHVYIYATGWSPGVGKPFFEQFQEDEAWQVLPISCGHYVMIDMPKELAQILIASI